LDFFFAADPFFGLVNTGINLDTIILIGSLYL